MRIFLILTFLTIAQNSVAEKIMNRATNYSVVADYLFDGNFISSVAGAPNITFLDTQMNFQEQNVFGVNRTVLNMAQGTGLSLDVSSLIPDNDYSIAMVFKITGVEGFIKLIDFKNLSDDAGLYNLEGQMNFFPLAEDETTLLANHVYAQLFMTRSSSGIVKIYVNRQLILQFTDQGNQTMPSAHNLLHFLRDDNTTFNNEVSAGTIARITVFNRDLDLQDIQSFPQLDTIFSSSFN